MMFAVGKSMENCEKFTPKILRFMSYLDCLINCKLKHRMELQEMFIFQSKSSCVYITLPTIHLPLALYLISFHLWWSNDQLNTKTVSPLLCSECSGPAARSQCSMFGTMWLLPRWGPWSIFHTQMNIRFNILILSGLNWLLHTAPGTVGGWTGGFRTKLFPFVFQTHIILAPFWMAVFSAGFSLV